MALKVPYFEEQVLDVGQVKVENMAQQLRRAYIAQFQAYLRV